MELLYNTMDKEDNIKMLPLFANICNLILHLKFPKSGALILLLILLYHFL
jgi:hypothetical protein